MLNYLFTQEQLDTAWLNTLRSKRTGSRLDLINKLAETRVDGEYSNELAVSYNGSDKSVGVRFLDVKPESDGTYTLFLENGSYTFKKGKVKSEKTSKGEYVTVPAMSHTADVRGSDETGDSFGVESDELFQSVEKMDLGTALSGLFWNLEAEDREAKTSTGEQSAVVPIRTQEFVNFTEHLIESYKATMSKLGNGEVDIALYKNNQLNTSGTLDLETKKMSLRYNRMSRTARMSEIFLHEVNHLISADVFASNPRLRRLMKDLKEAALASGVDYTVFLQNAPEATSEEIEIAKRKFDYVFDESADPEEFYAYATTNEDVYMAIKDVQVKAELVKSLDVVETTMQKILQKLIKVINVDCTLL